MRNEDVAEYNRQAWDAAVAKGDRWSIPVEPRRIADARAGRVDVVLTPVRCVPESWLQPLSGRRVLALASAGGQQGPLLAAAGAHVTVLDASGAMLGRDREVAQREQLEIELVQGDMRDLSMLADETFDLVFHPVSNCFVPDVNPVWREVSRVLKPGGVVLAGFYNPTVLCFDPDRAREGQLFHRFVEPYSDISSLSDEERARYLDALDPLVFGHSLEDQIGGQLRAGLALVDLYSDGWGKDEGEYSTFDRHLPSFFATRSVKWSDR